MEKLHDTRWQTRNTKLASALLCKGFQLAAQPFLTNVSGGKQTTTIFFQPSLRINSEDVECSLIEEAWQVAEYGEPEGMPELYWMRGALYARDYLIVTYIHAEKVPTSGRLLASDLLKTDDLNLAACLKGAGYDEVGFKDNRFYFDNEARREAIYYDNKESAEHPMRWRRFVLLQQYALIGAIKQHQSSMVRIVRGPRNSSAIIPSNMTQDLMRKVLRELHKNH